MPSVAAYTATSRIHNPTSLTPSMMAAAKLELARGKSHKRSSQFPNVPIGPIMRPLRLRRTLGVKLGLAFAGVLAVMLASLALVLVKSSEASHAYERALAWKAAVEGSAKQAAGTRQQQASQALYVATGEVRYKQEWQA